MPPIICDEPQSASLVTTAGLMSTQTTGTHAGQQLADSDAVQHPIEDQLEQLRIDQVTFGSNDGRM